MVEDNDVFWIPLRGSATFDIQNAKDCKTTAIFKRREDAVEFCRHHSDGTEVIKAVNIVILAEQPPPAEAAKGRRGGSGMTVVLELAHRNESVCINPAHVIYVIARGAEASDVFFTDGKSICVIGCPRQVSAELNEGGKP